MPTFYTVRLVDPASTALTDHIILLGDAFRRVRARMPFQLDAWVVLPDHLHAIWTLPHGDYDAAARWHAIKIAFSKARRKAGPPVDWQPGFQSHPISGEAEFAGLLAYMHANPKSHGLCNDPHDWPWSSLRASLAER